MGALDDAVAHPPLTVGPTVFRSPGPPLLELLSVRTDGPRGSWDQLVLVAQGGRRGAVAIALRGDDVLLVHQFRPATGRWHWELPRGFGDPEDASPAETAARELAEETGARVGSSRVLGTVFADTGILATGVDVVLVEVTGLDADLPAGSEVSDRRWVSRPDLDRAVVSGALTDGISLAALMLWRAHDV